MDATLLLGVWTLPCLGNLGPELTGLVSLLFDDSATGGSVSDWLGGGGTTTHLNTDGCVGTAFHGSFPS